MSASRKFTRRQKSIPNYLKTPFKALGRKFICIRGKKYDRIYEAGKQCMKCIVKKNPKTGYYATQVHGFWHTASSLARVVEIFEQAMSRQPKIPSHMWQPVAEHDGADIELDMAMF